MITRWIGVTGKWGKVTTNQKHARTTHTNTQNRGRGRADEKQRERKQTHTNTQTEKEKKKEEVRGQLTDTDPVKEIVFG